MWSHRYESNRSIKAATASESALLPAPGPPSVGSVEAGGPGFLDCLPRTVIVIGAIADVCRIVAVAGVVAAVGRGAIITVSAARDRATDDGTSQRARSPAKTSMSPPAAAPATPAHLNRTIRNHGFHHCHVGRQWCRMERGDVAGHQGSGECACKGQSEAMHVFLRHLVSECFGYSKGSHHKISGRG